MPVSEDRLSKLEQQTAASWQRIDHLEAQEKALWNEVRSMNAQGREDFRQLRDKMQSDKEELSALIVGNRMSGAAKDAGSKMLFWGIGTLIAVGTLAAGVASVIARWWQGG